eukprot:TRINITY_DN2821_c3_g1_i2.p3 TRINITY_DN2821_c3_g1~~TRINITY_DN2821_c3_g1_i2.p3  ORF type:complete len:246 (+),score=-17.50 TRINITY_DN2821_c3_g1_i2:1161-1898(+)
MMKLGVRWIEESKQGTTFLGITNGPNLPTYNIYFQQLQYQNNIYVYTSFNIYNIDLCAIYIQPIIDTQYIVPNSLRYNIFTIKGISQRSLANVRFFNKQHKNLISSKYSKERSTLHLFDLIERICVFSQRVQYRVSHVPSLIKYYQPNHTTVIDQTKNVPRFLLDRANARFNLSKVAPQYPIQLIQFQGFYRINITHLKYPIVNCAFTPTVLIAFLLQTSCFAHKKVFGSLDSYSEFINVKELRT